MDAERVVEAAVGVKFKVNVRERVEERKQVLPGRLLELTVRVSELAEDLPSYVEIDPAELARIKREHVTRASGFYTGSGGAIAEAEDSKTTRAILGGGLIGPVGGGRPLEPGDAFAKLADAIAAGRFTLDEIGVFAQDPIVLRVLRRGAIEHVGALVDHQLIDKGAQGEATVLAAIAKARLVRGFEGGDRTELLEYLAVAVARSTIPGLFELASRVRQAAPSD